MNRPYSTDEAVIQQCAFLYDYYGDTPAFCRALDNLTLSFQDPNQEAAWKGIFEGVKSQANEKYEESLANFEKVGHLIKENTLLHSYFQRQKLYSYVVSAKKDTKEVESLYSQLADQYKDNPDPFIQWQVAGAMLDGSYAAGVISGETGLLEVDDEIIRNYENSPDINIQIVVVKTMINKANDLSNTGFKEEAVSLIGKIEEKYHDSKEARIIKQVVRALNYKAFLFYEDGNLEKALQEYRKTVNAYSGRNNAYIFEDLILKSLSIQAIILAELNRGNKALVLFDKIYNSHKNSNNLNVQDDLLLMVLAEMEFLKKVGNYNRQIRIADKALKQFQKSDVESIQLNLLKIKFEKAKTLYQQGKWHKEIGVYDSIINRLKNDNPSPSNIDFIFRAIKYKIISLEQMGRLDEAVQTSKEAVDSLKKSEIFDGFSLAVLTAKQAELLGKADKYDEYLIIYNDVFEKYINSDNADIRNLMVRLIFNRAHYEGRREKQAEKKRLYKQIIDLFKNDADVYITEVVANAIFRLGEMLQKEKEWDEAIQVFYGAKNYSNYNNNNIQFLIALSLDNRIKCLKAKESKTEEIKAACEEFKELFSSSGVEEIKKMVEANE